MSAKLIRRALIPVALFAVSAAAGTGLAVQLPDDDTHARSDRFWSLPLVRGMSAELYGSLDDMALSADTVIVGRIVEVTAGRAWDAERDEGANGRAGDPPTPMARFAEATIEIEQVIGGSTYDLGSGIRLEIFLPRDGMVPELQANLPRERALFFLRNKGPTDSTEHYRLVSSSQGLFREMQGVVHLPVSPEGAFVRQLEGLEFETLIARVVDLRR